MQSVVERRNTIPILSNVLVEAADNALALTATDMDLTIIERVVAAVGARGATTVAAHTLFDIVRKLPEGAQVQIESTGDGGQVTLKAGRSRFVLQTLPKEDFPTMSSGEAGPAERVIPCRLTQGSPAQNSRNNLTHLGCDRLSRGSCAGTER